MEMLISNLSDKELLSLKTKIDSELEKRKEIAISKFNESISLLENVGLDYKDCIKHDKIFNNEKSENMVINNRNKQPFNVYVMNINGVDRSRKIGTYNSQKIASEELGITNTLISECLNKKRNRDKTGLISKKLNKRLYFEYVK